MCSKCQTRDCAQIFSTIYTLIFSSSLYLSRFRTEHRGLVDVKGKGRLDTYWLVGKEGGVGKWNEMDYEYSAEEGPAYMKDISEMPGKF